MWVVVDGWIIVDSRLVDVMVAAVGWRSWWIIRRGGTYDAQWARLTTTRRNIHVMSSLFCFSNTFTHLTCPHHPLFFPFLPTQPTASPAAKPTSSPPPIPTSPTKPPSSPSGASAPPPSRAPPPLRSTSAFLPTMRRMTLWAWICVGSTCRWA